MSPSKFNINDHVRHAANGENKFPAGSGRITSVTPWNTADGYSYQVMCDKTSQNLGVNFKESELELIK